MKRILVCIMVVLLGGSIILGCLPGIDNSSIQKADNDKGRSTGDQIVESMPGYGYAYLHTVTKGGVIS